MTYTIYELKLKPLSSWITDLTADTIFGHLCWQIKYEFGDEVLKEFLEEMKKEPIFTISDVLPSDRLPKPLTEFDGDLGDIDEDDFETNKKYKKIDFIFKKTFKDNFLGKSINDKQIVWDIKREIEDEKKFKDIEKHIENKNIVNRLSGATGNNGIYSQSINVLINDTEKFIIYLKILDKDKFDKYKKVKDEKIITLFDLIKKIFNETGYGKKKSSGKGYFEIIENWKESELNTFSGKNILLLSSFIPSKKDQTNGNYKIFTKFPKLGEEFSIEGKNFYKKPLVMIDKGATFEKSNNYNGYVGKMIKNSAIDKNIRDEKGNNIEIYHYAYGFILEF